MLKEEYNKILDWLEDFISSGQADEELGSHFEEQDLVKYLKDNFIEIFRKINKCHDNFFNSCLWPEFYTLFFKKEKYIIENNVLIRPCLTDIKKAHDIPNTVKRIDKEAFACCYSLESIYIPNTVKNIGLSAFENCTNLTHVTLENSLTNICTYVFYGCENLSSITIPDKVKTIGSYAFGNCRRLTSVNLPNNLQTIKLYAFYNCNNLKTINFNGTKEEWKNITKYYDFYCLNRTIHCNDGNLKEKL